jgi:predicted tellurium resistance membrane protein TerC
MWRDISGDKHHAAPQITAGASAKRAVLQILVADISMSLDNVLAVAGAARDHLDVLIIGLLMSVGLMGAAATFIAKLLERHRWIAYIGLGIVVYVAVMMVWHGGSDVMKAIN